MCARALTAPCCSSPVILVAIREIVTTCTTTRTHSLSHQERIKPHTHIYTHTLEQLLCMSSHTQWELNVVHLLPVAAVLSCRTVACWLSTVPWLEGDQFVKEVEVYSKWKHMCKIMNSQHMMTCILTSKIPVLCIARQYSRSDSDLLLFKKKKKKIFSDLTTIRRTT